MPELPEVETIRRGIRPHVIGKEIADVSIRTVKLRWEIPQLLLRQAVGMTILAVERRGKVLMLRLSSGTMLFHFGMTGHLQYLGAPRSPGPHDHVDLLLNDGSLLRYRDPRRFGAVLWCEGDPANHPLIAGLGPEPLRAQFTVAHLQQAVFKKPHRTIKETIMDGNVVAGIGNMYASEALFRSRIDPAAPAGILSPRHLELLVEHIIETLKVALQEGEEFIKRVDSQNTSPGHFDVSLLVYGREGKSCGTCGSTIRRIIIGGRATFFCPRCQEMPDFPLFEA